MTLTQTLRKMNQAIDLENSIYNLLCQQNLLQRIDKYTNNRLDFGDLIETHSLLKQEINRLREHLQKITDYYLEIPGKKECFEEEEEEYFSSSYNIKHIIRDQYGKSRPVTSADLDMDNNKSVLNAFKVLYEISQTQDDNEEPTPNKFALQDKQAFKETISRK